MKKKIWVVIANGSIARILRRSDDDENQWIELKSLINPEGRIHGAEATNGEVRHSIAGRTGLAPREDPKEHARQAFAQRVAGQLHDHLNHHEIESVVIFASNPFLGSLLDHLDSETQKRLRSSHPLDLTHLNLIELTQRLNDEFKLNVRHLADE